MTWVGFVVCNAPFPVGCSIFLGDDGLKGF